MASGRKPVTSLHGINKRLDKDSMLVSGLSKLKIKDRKLLGSYLAGLIEADGALITPQGSGTAVIKNGGFIRTCFRWYSRVKITQTIPLKPKIIVFFAKKQ